MKVRSESGVKIDPKSVPNVDYEEACRILCSSIRLALSDPVLRKEFVEWTKIKSAEKKKSRR